MTPDKPEPVRAPSTPADHKPEVVERQTSDPWGIRRAELLLGSLKGILSARMVTSETGEITEVHVLSEASIRPKQVVRNVESALLAQLGLKIDHRKISVAQTAEVLPIEAMEERVVSEKSRKRGVVFRRVEVAPLEGSHRVRVTVTLERDGEELIASEEAGDALKMRLQAAARATVTAVDSLVPGGTVDLAGSRVVEAFDTELVFVGIHVLVGREMRLHLGSCEIRDSAEQAVVLAVLDACNRWLAPVL